MEASNGIEALEVFKNHEGDDINLLITDVIMPQMSGKELADRVINLHPDIKVLFMSGYTDDIIARHGLLPSGVHYAEKPFSPQSFASKVRHVLDS